jgi:hypothetical protein
MDRLSAGSRWLTLCKTNRGCGRDFAFSQGHEPLYGFEATREAAMQSFVKTWFRD